MEKDKLLELDEDLPILTEEEMAEVKARAKQTMLLKDVGNEKD